MNPYRLLMALLPLCAPLLAHAAVPPAYATLAAAEREFAADGLRRGVQKSFLTHFAADGIVMRPFAVPAAQFYRDRPDPPGGTLRWAPQYLAVSAAGDLGLSTGPWRAEGERDGKPFAAHGHFFTVWKNDGRGHWQVLFDHGVGHAPPPTPVETTALVALPVGKADASGRSAVESRRAALTAADDALRERLAGGASGAYASLASADTLWLRDGALPQRGAQPPGAEGAPSVCGCGPRIRIGMAASADFGYTIGGREDQRDKGIDVRIWKFDGSGWSLVADLVAAVQ
jgi:hypothetical protein